MAEQQPLQSETPPLDVVVIGPVNIDLIISGDAPHDHIALLNWMALSDVTLNAAGSAGYPALVLQKLGLQTGLISVVAGDSLGEVIRQELAQAGIDLTRLAVEAGAQSSIAIYMLLFGSKKRPLTGRPVLHRPWTAPLSAADKAYLAHARLIHIAGYLHYPQMWDDDIPLLLHEAKARGQMVSLDPQFPLFPVEGRWLPGVEKLLPYVDVLFLDQDEARGITGLDSIEAAGMFLRAMSAPQSQVIIKRGSAGVTLFTRGGSLSIPAQRVEEAQIMDTIGAGDAFDAGFLAATLRGCSAQESAQIGSYLAALSLRGRGAVRALTADDTIDGLIRQVLGR